MKIGIFTDFYHPSTNGVVFVVDILQKNLQKLGHEVLVVAPRPGLTARYSPQVKGVKVLWVPAIDGLFFDEYLASVFVPNAITKKIEKENLDIILFITPGQIGLLGAYAAKRLKIPLVQQYSTDLVEYVNHYKTAIPGIFALSFAAPITFKMKIDDIAILSATILKGRKDKSLTVRQDITKKMLIAVHNNCDALICVSDKTAETIRKDGVETDIFVIPTGVNKLVADSVKIDRKRLGISEDQVVLLSVGRPTKEKNLELLIASFDILAKQNPSVSLVIAGDSSYKPKLETIANASKFKSRIIFTGLIKRNNLENLYNLADIFCFTSLTDTQGLVLNEAAYSGLPIVWCDPGVNKVAVNGVNGLLAKPNAKNFAEKLNELVTSPQKRQDFSINSRKIAAEYSEIKQTEKLANTLKLIIKRHSK